MGILEEPSAVSNQSFNALQVQNNVLDGSKAKIVKFQSSKLIRKVKLKNRKVKLKDKIKRFDKKTHAT